MTQHKYAELLRYAADNADARFSSDTCNNIMGYKDTYPIANVLNTELDDWQIYKEPVTETVWYRKIFDGNLITIEGTPDLESWFMKITYVGGVPTKAEFAE
jgi:hypothetical protein